VLRVPNLHFPPWNILQSLIVHVSSSIGQTAQRDAASWFLIRFNSGKFFNSRGGIFTVLSLLMEIKMASINDVAKRNTIVDKSNALIF
jgi:hypothetical protein